MDFQKIKPLVQRALSAGFVTFSEREAVRTAVLSDSNKERASLLMEALGLQPASPSQE